MFAKNKSADQPAHPRRLISAFVIHLLYSIKCKLASGEILIFKLSSVAEETGLKLFVGNPEDGFSRDEALLTKTK